MKRFFRIFVALAALGASMNGVAGAAGKGDADKGRRRYMAVGCSQCHGTEAQGGGRRGPALVPDVFPYEALLYQLRQPRETMPVYSSKILSDEDVLNIHAYLLSIRPTDTSKAMRILQLD